MHCPSFCIGLFSWLQTNLSVWMKFLGHHATLNITKIRSLACYVYFKGQISSLIFSTNLFPISYPPTLFFLQLKHYRPHRPFWIYIYINCLLLVWLALSCIFTKICISGHSLITLVSGSILFFFWFFMFILPFHQPKYGLWHTDFTVLLYHVIYLQLKFSYLKSFFSKYAETLFNLVSLISDPVRLKKC